MRLREARRVIARLGAPAGAFAPAAIITVGG
jgi:hypothetical protein